MKREKKFLTKINEKRKINSQKFLTKKNINEKEFFK